jgi:hypothetical protein
MKVLLLGKSDKKICKEVQLYLESKSIELTTFLGEVGEPFPEKLNEWSGNLILSFLSPWILKESLLNKAENGAYNWHPAPPEMPGFGGASFAIYKNVDKFGFTAHEMTASVDAGPIIDCGYFNVSDQDTVESLSYKSYETMFKSFKDKVDLLILNKEIPVLDVNWGGGKTSRSELDNLCELSEEEIGLESIRRIKANTFGDRCWAFIKIGNQKYSITPIK